MRTGVWLIGARGSVATTVVAGAAAVRAGLAPATGCVTEGDDFAAAGLPALGDLVFGGHDLAETCLPKRAEQLARSGVLPERLPELIQDDLLAADAEIRPGAGAAGAGPRTQAEVAAALAADIGAFRERRAIDRAVVSAAPGARLAARARRRAGVGRPGGRGGGRRTAAQLAVRLRGVVQRLRLRRLHAVNRRPAARHRRACPHKGRAVRGQRRQDGRDVGALGARADVRPACAARAVVA